MVANAPDAVFVRNCGQFSSGRPGKCRGKNNMIGDGALEEGLGENRFGAVATPL
jgi:hypothetical protein